jgi:hypothetical protein
MLFAWLRRKSRKPSTNSKIREYLHIILSIVSFIDIIIALSLSQGLVVSKFIRLIRITISIRSLREAIKRIVYVLFDSKEILLLLISYIVFSSWAGYRLFRGTPEGEAYFTSLSSSCWSLLILMTTANFPDVMLPAYKMGTIYVLFFVAYLIFGLYFLMNLLIAVFSSNYKNRVEQSINKFVNVRENYLEKKFFEYDVGNKGYLTEEECKKLIEYLLLLDSSKDIEELNLEEFVMLLDKDSDRKITLSEFYNYFDVMDVMQFERGQKKKKRKRIYKFQKSLCRIMKSPFYDLCVYLVLIANLMSLFVRDWMDQYGGSKEDVIVWIDVQVIINFMFTAELVAVFVVDGSFWKTLKKLSVRTELIYTLMNVLLLIKFKIFESYGLENRLLELIILFRALRILKMLKEVDQWRIILQTIDALLSPFYTLVLVEFLIFYLFAIVGDRLFGGKVSINSKEILQDESIPNGYIFMNFNDTLSSFITLFALMVVNNWFVIVNVYVGATRNYSYKIFFI